MKQKVKIFLILVAVDIVIAFIYYLVTQVRFSFLDAAFLIGLMYLISGAALLIHESGFFNPAKYFFHKLPIFPKSRSRITNENDEEMTLLEYIKYRPTPLTSSKPLFLSGIFLVVLTYIISVALY